MLVERTLSQLRNTNEKDVAITIDDLTNPFIQVVEAPFLAAPIKLVALEAINFFFQYNVLVSDNGSCCQVLEKIISGLTRYHIFLLF